MQMINVINVAAPAQGPPGHIPPGSPAPYHPAPGPGAPYQQAGQPMQMAPGGQPMGPPMGQPVGPPPHMNGQGMGVPFQQANLNYNYQK
jgi:hypothetical protein